MLKTVTCYTITVTEDHNPEVRKKPFTATINNHLYPGSPKAAFDGKSIDGVIKRAAAWTREN